MKIALIGRFGEGDIFPGPERVSRELYLQLKKQDIDVTFIEYFFSGYSGYTLFNKLFGKKTQADSVLRLGIITLIIKLLNEQFDIIHFVNSQRFSLVIFFLKPFLKGKFISSFHGLNKTEIKDLKLKRSFLDLWVERKSIKKSDILIFPSHLLFNLFRKNYNFLKDKCRVIHNGVSEVFQKNKNLAFSLRSKESGEVKTYNFVYYNSFGKGLKEIIEVLPEKLNFHLRIFVIGSEERLENDNKNIEVKFVPSMSQAALLEFLSDKHFIIKSSAFDSFSIFTAECMTLGIIPIVSENTGIKELIENNVNGFICNDIKENLSTLLKEIFENKFNLNEISQNASRVYEELNWENVSEQYLKLYSLF